MSEKNSKKPFIPTSLKFGIKELDDLIKIRKSERPQTICLVGPDGCGKSILALHLASNYWYEWYNADQEQKWPKRGSHPLILYVSTDFSLDQAHHAWKSFGLDRPKSRQDALNCVYRRMEPFVPAPPSEKVALNGTALDLQVCMFYNLRFDNDTNDGSGGDDEVETRLLKEIATQTEPHQGIYFVDLQANSAGDDWSFLSQVVGLLHQAAIPHLIVVDAVEGLETFVGERDSFGEIRTRRSRVAQLVRSCTAAGAHVAFVVEEEKQGHRHPEQFITDTVLRFAVAEQEDYVVRTVEVEKCRGSAHARGKHELSIRNGKGTTTGKSENYDMPTISWFPSKGSQKTYRVESKEGSCLSHVYIVPSVHWWNRNLRFLKSDVPVARGVPTFTAEGMPLLGELPQCDNLKFNEHMGSVTVLQGESGTYKSRLSRSFLASALNRFFNLKTGKIKDNDGVKQEKTVIFESNARSEATTANGIAVLITTGLIDELHLRELLAVHLGKDAPKWNEIAGEVVEVTGNPASTKDHVICRRMSSRYFSSAQFLKTIEFYITRAQRVLLRRLVESNINGFTPAGSEVLTPTEDNVNAVLEDLFTNDESRAKRAQYSGAIHLVIDDWEHLLNSHPNIRNDALFLPSLLALFNREGVSAMIVSTQRITPVAQEHTGSDAPNDLKSLDVHQIRTWEVPLFGTRRVAMSVSSIDHHEQTTDVFELAGGEPQESGPGERVHVRRDFSLYTGLQADHPVRVPLHVRLYGGPHVGQPSNTDHENSRFAKAVGQTFNQLFQSKLGSPVVSFEPFENYDDYFAFADWLDNTHLDHTLVLQIDEFWSADKPSLHNLSEYCDEVTGTVTLHKEFDQSGNIVSRHPIEDKDSKQQDSYKVFSPHLLHEAVSEDGKAKIVVPLITSRVDYDGEITKVMKDDKSWNVKRSVVFAALEDGGIVDLRGKSSGKDDDTVDNEACESRRIDRIPYLWDFGLILARKDYWEACYDHALLSTKRKVFEVWNDLCLKPQSGGSDEKNRTSEVLLEVGNDAIRSSDPSDAPVNAIAGTWSEFFEAAEIVAEANDLIPFDVDLNTAESLSCFLLEVWGTLSIGLKGKDSKFSNLTNRSTEPQCTLKALIEAEQQTLFLALNQVFRVCGHLATKSRQIVRGAEPRKAAASREWFSTASAIVGGESPHQYRLLRLPGRLSTRGDWALALAAGSRSKLLGYRAIDMLSSRRMALLRLHDGLGLPVRDVLPDASFGKVQTAITRHDPLTNKPEYLTYGEICRCGVIPEFKVDIDIDKDGTRKKSFDWLWRSRIKNYDRDCFYLRRWLVRMVDERHSWVKDRSAEELGFIVKLRDCRPDVESDKVQDERDKFIREVKWRVSVLTSVLRE